MLRGHVFARRTAGLAALAWLAVATTIAGFPGGSPDEWKAPARASKKKNPVAADESSIALGRKLYVRECAACHGRTGKGDGPSAKDLERKAGDLSSPDMWDQTDGALYWKITTGNKPMPAYESLMKDEERWHVVNFMRTLAPKETPAAPQFGAPEEVRSALSGVVRPYLQAQDALARDDVERAKLSAADLAVRTAKLDQVGVDLLAEPARGPWRVSCKALAEAGGALKAAGDLPSLRQAFRACSEALITALEKFGHHEDAPLSLVHCPKAFEGAGANWLQSDRQPANPYLGASSPTCGVVQKRLGALKDTQ